MIVDAAPDDAICDILILTDRRNIFPHVTDCASKRRQLQALRPVNDNTPYEFWVEWR